MTPQIDDDFIKAMGIDVSKLSEDEKQEALYNLLYVLNMRVAERVSGALDENQLKEFNELTEREADEQEVAKWLASNVPNYMQIIEEEAQEMKKTREDRIKKVMEG